MIYGPLDMAWFLFIGAVLGFMVGYLMMQRRLRRLSSKDSTPWTRAR